MNAANGSTPSVTGGTGPYGLRQPALADAHAALATLCGAQTDEMWQKLLAAARLTGRESDLASFMRLVDAMKAADPVTALCGRSLGIRAAAFTHLSTAHDLIRNAQ